MKLFKSIFSNVLERLQQITWRVVFEDHRRLEGLLKKVSLIVTNRLTSETGISWFLFARRVVRLTRPKRYLATALYLKQCGVCLQQFYAEHPRQLDDNMKVWVSLTRCGIPRIIPPFHRKIIKRRGERGDRIVRLYLSWFQICRLVLVAPKVTKDTFRSIVEPCNDIQKVLNVCTELKEEFSSLYNDYIPWASEIPVKQGISWIPTWKSLPNSDLDTASREVPSHIEGKRPVKVRANCFTSLKYELAAFADIVNVTHSLEGMFSPGVLWVPRIRYPMDPSNTKTCNLDLSLYEETVGPVLTSIAPALKECGFNLKYGRLASSVEGSGKRRIFAIGNYVKQRLLYPYHNWLMSILRRLPCDGTYCQDRPIGPLINKSECYSFDLSAATDRWPLTVMYHIMMMLFGPSLASSIVNATLGLNTFLLPKSMTGVYKKHGRIRRIKRKSVEFVCGQPLGYYSSWPLFALSHHFMVWLAARRVGASNSSYMYGCFKAYAILGDDIVITDPRVAQQYSNILGELGVKINKSKSIISKIGGFEFAKRFYVRGQNLTPVSVRSLLMCNVTRGLLSIADKYKIKNFSLLAKLGGHGYRSLGRLYHQRSKKLERLWIGFNRPDCDDPLLFDLWLGRGSLLNPYLKGIIVDFMRRKLYPTQLTLVPDELTFDGELEILERTCLRSWMTQWLNWMAWYHTVALAPDPNLLDLFNDCPVVETKWYRRAVEPLLVRFGYLWKVYDLIGSLGCEWLPGILEPSSDPFIGWVQGGPEGSRFLMVPDPLVKVRRE